MLIRIVRMTFDPTKVDEFLRNFDVNKYKIRRFDGCERLEMWRDKGQGNVFMTYSWWESEAHLEAYRNSELFQSVWANTKPLFSAKPVAWSVEQRDILD